MDRKTVRMKTYRIESLPDNRPVVYKIRDSEGDNIYTGSAGKGNVQSRIKDHLPGRRDAIPGAAKVQIEQHSTIREARRKEANIIVHSKPKYNQQGK